MKLQQLRYLCEVVDHELNVTSASHVLNRSQPGVSRYIKELEVELGADLFERSGRRLTGLTAFGTEVLAAARQVMLDVEAISNLARDRANQDFGPLMVATTHTHARYLLPEKIRTFTERFPHVDLSLRQGNPTQVAQWVANGEAHVSIASSPLTDLPTIALLPSRRLRRIVLTPQGHPLRDVVNLSLADLARFRMITYDRSFTGSARILAAFEQAGLSPRISLSATDGDVMKAYVRTGLGIAIVADVVYTPEDEADLDKRDVSHLFEDHFIYIGVPRQSAMRRYVYSFIEIFDSDWTPARVRRYQEQQRFPEKSPSQD
jgi:LysR family cys regulon transcriptional activator